MTFQYGRSSTHKLSTVDPLLRSIMYDSLDRSPVDITIVHGWRNRHHQNRLFDQGVSKLQWPHSKHNHMLDGLPSSRAVDFAPWVNGTIPWEDTHLFALVAGVIFTVAVERDVDLRWGGDWDMDGLTTDQSFMDWGHIERV